MATIKMSVTFEDDNSYYDFLIKNSDKIASEINEKLAHIQYVHASEIAKNAVDAFYSSFPPNSYKRRNDLYNAYDVGIQNGTKFMFKLSPELMSGHHQGPEFVYENSFVRGYHGGSFGDAVDPNGFAAGETPYWRTPAQLFTHWMQEGGQAPQDDESPRDKIIKGWNSFIDNEGQQIKKDVLNEVAGKYMEMFAAKSGR